MQYSLAAFYEPRGVMRIIQFVFAIIAFSTTANFTATVQMECKPQAGTTYNFDYPFRFEQPACNDTKGQIHSISADVSSDAQFFVATGVLSMMYCIFIIAVYAIIDELYRTKTEFPLADFFLTTILAIFWLSGSAAWSNGATGLKTVTDATKLHSICDKCTFYTTSFSKLNISLIIGYLNFFLWASDLWFLYKETVWFQGRLGNQSNGPSGSSMTQPDV